MFRRCIDVTYHTCCRLDSPPSRLSYHCSSLCRPRIAFCFSSVYSYLSVSSLRFFFFSCSSYLFCFFLSLTQLFPLFPSIFSPSPFLPFNFCLLSLYCHDTLPSPPPFMFSSLSCSPHQYMVAVSPRSPVSPVFYSTLCSTLPT